MKLTNELRMKLLDPNTIVCVISIHIFFSRRNNMTPFFHSGQGIFRAVQDISLKSDYIRVSPARGELKAEVYQLIRHVKFPRVFTFSKSYPRICLTCQATLREHTSEEPRGVWYRPCKKVKLSLCLINYASRHEDVLGSGGIAPSFLTSAIDGGDWSASRPSRFPLAKHSSVPIGQ
jgi:hypothetical protein